MVYSDAREVRRRKKKKKTRIMTRTRLKSDYWNHTLNVDPDDCVIQQLVYKVTIRLHITQLICRLGL
jgi:hypothetical protein